MGSRSGPHIQQRSYDLPPPMQMVPVLPVGQNPMDALQQVLATNQVTGNMALQQLLPQLLAAVQQQGGPPPIINDLQSGRPSFASEQAQLGVRVQEFHALSTFAAYVRPAAAIRLQMLWDRGNRLVSLLDDLSWEVLTDLPAPEALIVIDETADR